MRAALRGLSHGLLALGLMVLLTWAVTRVTTDRWLWSQYLFWAPSPLVLAGGAMLLAASGVSARFGRHAPGRAIVGRRLRWGALMLLIGAAGVMLVREWRVLNVRSSAPPSVIPQVRVVNWNVTAVEIASQVHGPVQAQAPDVAILVNPHSRVAWGEVYQALGDLPHRAMGAGRTGIIVLSRYAVVREGWCTLGLPTPTDDGGRRAAGARADPGRAMFVELDTSAAIGRTIIVWVIDLPSDERLSRWELAARAGAAIEGWSGGEGTGFPKPDLVIGDFNIPRGSASLSHLTRGLTNAFDEAGWGWCASYPRIRPLVHIDQAFVGPGLRALDYRVVDPTFGYHRLQRVDLAPAR